jgi:preprotein translocase subunit SecD
MKTLLVTIMSLALVSVSFAMDQTTIGISKVLDEPTRDSKDMILKHKETEETVHVDRNIVLYDKYFKEISIVEGDDVSILITLTDEGTKKFADLTKEMVGKRLAITANNRLLSAPVVQQPITEGTLQISGNMTKEQAEEMVALFKKTK